MSFEPSRIFPVLANAITPVLPPFSKVEQFSGPEDEITAFVYVLTPNGMERLLKVTLSTGSAGTAWADFRGLRNPAPWFASHWQRWEVIQKDVADRVNAVAAAAWACQPMDGDQA